MKIKLKEIERTLVGLRSAADKKLPIKISYPIAKNLSVFQKEYDIINSERIKLMESYADKDENGVPNIEDNQYKFSGNGLKLFQKEYLDYLETEIDVDTSKINIEDLDLLDDPRYDVLTPNEMSNALFFNQ